MTIVRATAERFWSKVNFDGPVPQDVPGMGRCWIWKGARDPNGYGRFHRSGGGSALAHRQAMELMTYEPVAPNLDHLCRTTACVRPSHLEAVSNRENCQRASVMRRTGFCHRGHPVATRAYRPADRRWTCNECRRMRRRYDALLRQQKMLDDLRGTDAESTHLRQEVRDTDKAIADLRDALDIPE